MSNENLETNEKLEKIEQSALENTEEVTPLENNIEVIESTESITEPSMELSTCICTGGCGSNFSQGSCTCMGNCGSNFHK